MEPNIKRDPLTRCLFVGTIVVIRSGRSGHRFGQPIRLISSIFTLVFINSTLIFN